MNQIKIRYVWRHIRTKELKLASFHIKVVEGCDIHSELHKDDWELISRDLWTGLTDKMGREIYAGDILRCRNWGRTDEVIGITAVSWSEDNRGWRYEDTSITGDDYDEFRNVQIIGTIHPNLLDSGDEK